VATWYPLVAPIRFSPALPITAEPAVMVDDSLHPDQAKAHLLPPGSPEGLIFRGIHASVVMEGGGSLNFPPSTIIEPHCTFIVGPEASMHFGHNVTIYSGCSFRNKYGAYKIGDEVSFGPRCAIYELRAGLTIGAFTMIGAGVCISGVNHGMDPEAGPYRFQPPRCLPVTIGSNVWIGMNSTILPGVSIGDNTVIGAGSVVTRSIPAGVVAYGSPCRVIRPVGERLPATPASEHDSG
jgi:acetyltransferase-like isoleucine patch superfamily enzyme